MGVAEVLAIAWLALSVPVSIVIGGLLRGDDRELIAVDGGKALYLMPDGSVAQTSIVGPTEA